MAARTSRTPLLALILLAACSTAPTATLPGTAPETATTVPATTTTAAPAEHPFVVSTPPTTAVDTGFAILPVTAEDLAHSWHEGCPVGPEDLRRVEVVHHDFSGATRTGAIVVHRDHAEDVAWVFERLFEAGYPIASVVPIGELQQGAEDEPGYDNTSGFHCRFVEGTTRWSEHAYGAAIDINVHLNPYVRGDYVWPAGTDRYLDRGLGEPGMIVEGDAVTRAFDVIGWGWGGRWRSAKDYQHFSASGR